MLEEMIGSAWRFERADGSLIAKVLLLLGDGVIGGYMNPNERRWVVRDGKLKFLDLNGVVTTSFDDVVTESGRVTRLTGQVRFVPSITHVLTRIEMPNGFDLGQSSQLTPADFLHSIPAPRRQNLVVLRANSRSLHTRWPHDIEDSDRNWDLCISWYDKALADDLGPHEYLTHQAADRKYGSIYALFQPQSPLWNYSYVWMPDDDLMTSWRDINRLFEICYRNRLALAQPSLRAGSFASHAVTMQDPGLALRFTEYVESMCPVFSIEALRTCIGTFKGSVSGWGIDFMWSLLLGNVVTRTAIIDEISVIHTRPIAANYDAAAATREVEGIMALYGARMPLGAVGNLLKAGVRML